MQHWGEISSKELIEQRDAILKRFLDLTDRETLEKYNILRPSPEELEKEWIPRLERLRGSGSVTLEQAIRDLVARIDGAADPSIKILAREYRPFLVEHRFMRASTKNAVPAMGRFLKKYVYDLIPEEQLPKRIRDGLKTGGIRHR